MRVAMRDLEMFGHKKHHFRSRSLDLLEESEIFSVAIVDGNIILNENVENDVSV